MEETLGSGFDNIRVAAMSPTSLSPRMTISPVSIHAVTDVARPSFIQMAETEATMDSGELASIYNTSNVRSRPSNLAPANPSESSYFNHSTSFSQETYVNSHEALFSQSLAGSDVSSASVTDSTQHLAGQIETNKDFEHGLHATVWHDVLYPEIPSPHSDSDGYESDPDDTRKFYTEVESYFAIGDDEYDTDDSEYYDTDDEYESSSTGQMLTSISRYDHRFHRYWTAEQSEFADDHFDAHMQTTQERNFTVDEFIQRWLHASLSNSPHIPPHFPGPSLEAANVSEWIRPEKIARPSTLGCDDFYDIQQIPWRSKLGVRREDARILRDAWYHPYTNLDFSKYDHAYTLPKLERYFSARALYTDFKATIEHFQLRNLMAVTSFNTVQFAHESQLLTWTPDYKDVRCIMDLSRPPVESGFQGSVKISTMQAKHGISVAGGFSGEYCMHVSGGQGENTCGFVTHDANGITNHIDIIRNRTGTSPMIVFASNDQHIRILNCFRNQFISDHELPIPVNCSETSADGRLRIVVGDSTESLVLEADSGRTLRQLPGHHDFGFACAWSPDMLHIATSNQDRTVNIWDVRMWRLLQSMNSDRACYRSLRFSPVGGGPRTLLMCEPADRISIVNATTYETRQVHDFFGEIGGADYTSDGESVWVANTDESFGGFMRFDRMQHAQKYSSSGASSKNRDIGRYEQDETTRFAPGWYSNLPHEWISEANIETDLRSVLSQRERDFRFLNGLSDDTRDHLLL
ncbi:WD repeat protein [Talaromyces stipitatus ATCC 10500]|uniref:WD repeat protein n=1 Tax=Talaromyces stipitatus (strain ATCC 10500 / CBS 375.48 / QM 6759 / NRRL 1006) TaxID=441959 RepID=B8MQG7_TALSN|nr:WD repeat protein [Talaromyces stipitatus ATCC 10500]EED13369.1 WD repeat protein [Talaromyces stipitatus ATCC 10500]